MFIYEIVFVSFLIHAHLELLYAIIDDPPSEDEGELLDDDSNQTTDDVIYENFGPDEGNKWMNTNELSQYIEQKGRDGLSQEYYKIKNEPLCGTSDIFK